ncbi:hypothetical protein HPP92_016369 [Vanilla planifolia]|uniref:Cyclin N-terminal domain-containing protein n=1 Tax=Vanilla planifolia TaxID=51239 RepID=A0A835QC43_VANPL|nr:hypothetical protein HPP92_016369 [Vanilla planifolia]
MGIIYDCASSILLCAEDKSSVLDFDEQEEVEMFWSDRSLEPKSCGFYGDLFMDFPLLSDECFGLLMKAEGQHLPREDYTRRLISGCVDVSIRRDAIEWMLKVHAHYNFGPLCAYLSVNYLDRFLSSYDLPKGKAWIIQLLSVACFSLAAKMEEIDAPLLLDLQVGEAKFVFEARTIKRMELLVLSTLKWRMQAVTPFSFLDYFIHKINGGNSPPELLLSRAMELILGTTRGIDFLAFKPSEIAAASALWAVGKAQSLDVEKAITCFHNIDQERVLRCYEIIQDEILESRADSGSGITSVLSAPKSPVGILDAACLSYQSDEMPCVSQPSTLFFSQAAKRRKISSPSFP